MRIKKILLLISALTIISLSFLVIDNAYAYRGDYTQKGPDCTSEKHEVMEEAFENNDYQAWKNLMQGKGRVMQVINEGNFAKFAQAHELAEQGKMDEAKQIREELGLGLKNGSGKNGGQGLRGKNKQ